MELKIGVLRNNLSRYLKRVRQTGDTIIVLDRNKPVAEIRSYSTSQKDPPPDIWARRRHFESEDGSLNEDFDLPVRRTDSRKHRNPLD